ncbi:BURP domain-containing protein 6-like [Silene latifolia]|uniref:BURP domain-containing protein 6-like n=1 Tax=Silene latifolia TaxID=37657 RepID=UPI003D76B065
MINHFAMEFQVFLVIVALLSVLMSTPVDSTESPGEAYWKTNIGSDSNMPKVVKDALLETGTNTASLENYAKRSAQAYAQELLKPKGGTTNVNYGYGAYGAQLSSDTNINYAKGAQNHNSKTNNFVQYFFEKDLIYPRSSMKLHFSTGAQKAKFMPLQVTKSIPFSSSKLPEILKFFIVNPGSQNAKIIEETITLCEIKAIKGEEKSCETSLEGMVNRAKSKLGNQIKAFSTEVNEETEQEYQIKSATKINNNEKNLVCHKMAYPYAVFYCHTLSKTDAYKVSLVDSTGKKVRAVAICHKDTSHWNEEHLAFQLLKVKPGSVPICHFLSVDAMVWVPK